MFVTAYRGGQAADERARVLAQQESDRAFLGKQRAFQEAQMSAGLDTLPLQTAAEKARLDLSSANSRAGLDMLPGQTANTVAQQRLTANDLRFAQAQQPTTQALTASDNAFKLAAQGKNQAIAGAGLDRAVADIPALEKTRLVTNASAANAQHKQALIDLSRYLKANDKNGALAHANAVADADAVRAGTKGKKFVDIIAAGEKSANGDGRVINLVADDGAVIGIPFSAIAQAAEVPEAGKFSMHHGRAGEVHVLNERTGQLTNPVPPNPELLRNPTANAHTPAILQLAQAYEAADPKLTKMQALEMAKTGVAKPREQFLLEMVGKQAMPGQDINRKYKEWEALYDNAKGASNNPQQPTIDPKFNKLFSK